MTKQEIIRELFVQSPVMAEHLCKEDNCDDLALLNLICSAPVSLQRKLELLRECEQMELQYPKGNWEPKDLHTACQQLIASVERAIAALEAKEGDIFHWWNCSHGTFCPDGVRSCGSGSIALNLEMVLRQINQRKIDVWLDWYDDLESIDMDRWYQFNKWEQRTGEDGQPELYCDWEFCIVGQEVCYFCHDDHSHYPTDIDLDWKPGAMSPLEDYLSYAANPGFWAEGNSIFISTPFQHGDIVTLDCRPFLDITHGVVIQTDSDTEECQVIHMAEWDYDNKKMEVTTLHYSMRTADAEDYFLSPFYRLALYDGELNEDEQPLLAIQERFKNTDKADWVELGNQIAYENRRDADIDY